jgi:hypothetical protein
MVGCNARDDPGLVVILKTDDQHTHITRTFRRYSLVTVPSAGSLHPDIPLIEHLLEILHLPVGIENASEPASSSVEALVVEMEDHLELVVRRDGVGRVGSDLVVTGTFADTAYQLAYANDMTAGGVAEKLRSQRRG